MQKTLKLFLENLVGLYQQAQVNLAQISSDPAIKAYGPAVVRAERLKSLTDARNTGLVMLNKFTTETWPLVQAERRASADLVRQELNGAPKRPPTSLTEDQWRSLGIMSSEARAVYLQGEAMRWQLEGVARITGEQHSLTMHSLRTTEALGALIESYRRSAASGEPADFDRAGWKVDRMVIPLVLAQRAQSGKDDRAALLAKSDFVAEIENAVIAQTVTPDLDSEFLLEKTSDALDFMVGRDGGQPVENLNAASEWFGFVSRRMGQPGPDDPTVSPAE
jgi:hypothetical protein